MIVGEILIVYYKLFNKTKITLMINKLIIFSGLSAYLYFRTYRRDRSDRGCFSVCRKRGVDPAEHRHRGHRIQPVSGIGPLV